MVAYIRSLGLLSQSDALGPMPSASAESGSTSDSQDTSRTVATRTDEAVRLTARQAEMLDWILSGLFYWRLRDPWAPAWLALNFTLILRRLLYAAYDNDDTVIERDIERPKGRLLIYWGCGANVGAGQPKVLDMATASTSDLSRFFVSRGATLRGAHSARGRPLWPSVPDKRMVPDGASLVVQHAFSGSGVPPDFRFSVPPAQDLMPALAVQNKDAGGATDVSWNAVPNTRAHFVAAMGAGEKEELVIWTSSQLPGTGSAPAAPD